MLQPLAEHQGFKIVFPEFRWIGPYVIETVLTNEYCIRRRLDSNKLHVLHRIRLREYKPNNVLQDDRPETKLQADDGRVIPQDDS